ncbi:hypothetical protein K53_054 [Salmonella phage Kenya-K53]|nr:hypothetical protein K53_054 [Salmonella phage Kenya-K53]
MLNCISCGANAGIPKSRTSHPSDFTRSGNLYDYYSF